MPRLEALIGEGSPVGEVRGRGAMLAMEFVQPGTKEPAPELAKAVAARATSRACSSWSCGTFGNVIRLLPPLVIGDDLLDDALDVHRRTAVEASHEHDQLPPARRRRRRHPSRHLDRRRATRPSCRPRRGCRRSSVRPPGRRGVSGSRRRRRDRRRTPRSSSRSPTPRPRSGCRGSPRRSPVPRDQLRFYGDVAAEGSYLGVTIDHATRPHPHLVRVNRPLGPGGGLRRQQLPVRLLGAGQRHRRPPSPPGARSS